MQLDSNKNDKSQKQLELKNDMCLTLNPIKYAAGMA